MQNDRVEFIGELTKKLFSQSAVIGAYWTVHPGGEVLDLVVLIKTQESALKYDAQYNLSLVKSPISVIVDQAFGRIAVILQESSQCN